MYLVVVKFSITTFTTTTAMHSLTQLPQPDGNPLHLVGKGGRKQDPMVPPVLTWH